MTIDVITKAGTQIGISMSPEELTASGWILDMIRMLIGGETENTPRAERTPEAIVVNLAAAQMKPKAPEMKNKVSAKEKNIDKGKICALWRSRKWSVIDIARDVGCSEQTVRNTLKANGLWALDEAEADLE